MFPAWLHDVSIAYLSFGWCCAAIIAADLVHHPQRMRIMNVVWPITALFGTAWILRQYVAYGRLAPHATAHAAKKRRKEHLEEPPNNQRTPFPIMVGNGALHCGSGCPLGDICAEWLAFAYPAIAVALGWQRLFPDKIFAVWILDCLFLSFSAPALA